MHQFVFYLVLVVFILGPIFLAWALIRIARRWGKKSAVNQLGTSQIAEYKQKKGRSYFYYRDASSRSKLPRGIGIDADISYNVRLEKNDGLNGMAVALGFTKRFESYDPMFDAQVYVYSDNPAFYDMLRQRAEVRQRIVELFQMGASSVFTSEGKLVAVLPVQAQGLAKKMISEDNNPAYKAADILYALLPNFMGVPAQTVDPFQSGQMRLDKIFKAIFRWLLIGGLMVAYLCFRGMSYQIADQMALVKLTLLCAVPVALLALALLRATVAETPYGADAFKAFMRLGIIGILAASYAGLYLGDIYLDHAAPANHYQRILRKHYTTGRHNSHSFYVTVENWQASGPVDISVHVNTYNSAVIGGVLGLQSHPGALGIEWISLP